MNQLMQLQGLLPILPEIVLALRRHGDADGRRRRRTRANAARGIVNGFCVAVLALAAFVVVMLPAGRTELFGGSFVVDDYARFLKLLALAGSGGALMLSLNWLDASSSSRSSNTACCSCSRRSA